MLLLQQCLPFTVLKHTISPQKLSKYALVATVLTVYGIETIQVRNMPHAKPWLQQCLPFTVLKQLKYTVINSIYIS